MINRRNRKCIPIRFGTTNDVPDAVLSSTPTVVSQLSLDNIKNELGDERARWTDPIADIVITGVLPEDRVFRYFALPGNNLQPESSIKLELFTEADPATDILAPELLIELGEWEAGYDTFGVDGDGYISMQSMVPMGQFRWGIDKWNTPAGRTPPRAFTLSINRAIKYRSFRLTIRHGITVDSPVGTVDLRMMMLGDMIQLQQNWEYGATLTRVSAPDISFTASFSAIQGRPQQKIRRLDLTLPCATDRDREQVADLEENLLGRPFIVSAYPNRSGFQYNDYNFLARLGNALPYAHVNEDIHEISQMILLEV